MDSEGGLDPLGHDACSREHERRENANLCTYCGKALGAKDIESGDDSHDECFRRQEFSRY